MYMSELRSAYERFAYGDLDFDGAHVLDAATGSGVTTLRLAQLVRNAGDGTILSVDLGADTRVVRRRLGDLGRFVSFRKADISNLSAISDVSFDIVVCHLTLSAVARRPLAAHRTLIEFNRVLAPGGALVVVDEVAMPKTKASRYSLQVRCRNLMKALAHIVGERTCVELDPTEICDSLSTIGFTDVTYRRFPGSQLTSGTMQEWTRTMRSWTKRVRRPDLKRAFRSEIASILDEYASSGGHLPPTYVVKARKGED
jgi:ubiquinone/menaquinone biosynthesis C-methylase UbiE